MVEPGTSSTERHFPTFHRIGRILYIMVRLKITRYLLLPLLLLYAVVWGVLRYNDHVLTKKYDQAAQDLEQLSIVIGQYKDKEGKYPRSMDDLVQSGLVGTPPVDPFSKTKEPYKIINLNDGAMVRVYSVGEDGEDNHSIKDYTVVAHEEVYYGEKGMGLYETLQVEWTKDDPDNGMSYFMRGMLASQVLAKDSATQKVALIVDFGWKDTFKYLVIGHEYLKRPGVLPPVNTLSIIVNPIPGVPLEFSSVRYDDTVPSQANVLEYFADNQAAFDYIREGAEKPYARFMMPEEGQSASLYMLSWPGLYLCRGLVAHGMWIAEGGNPQEAMLEYLATLRFGQALGHNNMELTKLTSFAIEDMAYRAIVRSVSSTEYEAGFLQKMISDIQIIERNRSPLADLYENQHIVFVSQLNSVRLMSRDNPFSVGEKRNRLPANAWLILNRGKMKQNNGLLTTQLKEYSQMPYPEAATISPDRFSDEMDTFNQLITLNEDYKKVHDTSVQSHCAAAKIVIGLRHHHAIHGTYPDSLDAIADLYESKTPPVDPFTTKAFVYEKSGDSFLLYSPGPELVDDKAAIEYDPTNGTMSVGDIVYGK